MTDLGWMLIWGLAIFLLSHCLLTFLMMEFSLDKKQKTEKDGTLRVKRNRFVIKYIYNMGSLINSKEPPKSLCMLFWGIYIGFLFDLMVVFFCSVIIASVGKFLYDQGFWTVSKFLLQVVVVMSVAILIFLFVKNIGKFKGEKFLATKTWLNAKKKKVCPLVKMVD